MWAAPRRGSEQVLDAYNDGIGWLREAELANEREEPGIVAQLVELDVGVQVPHQFCRGATIGHPLADRFDRGTAIGHAVADRFDHGVAIG